MKKSDLNLFASMQMLKNVYEKIRCQFRNNRNKTNVITRFKFLYANRMRSVCRDPRGASLIRIYFIRPVELDKNEKCAPVARQHQNKMK